MMFSMLLAPDTPEWVLTTVVVVFIIFVFGFGGWSLILEYRYINPYTLAETSNREKWRRAAILALLQTAMILFIGLAAPILSPYPDQWLAIPICGSIWIVLFPIATAYKRWEFERHIKRYQRLDKMIKGKNGTYQRISSIPVMRFTRMFMTADQKRFFNQGFPDNGKQEQKDES